MLDYLKIIADQQTLTQVQAEAAMHLMMRGEASNEAIAAFLMGLRTRGETLDELVGFTRVMRDYAVKVDAGDPDALDIVGTGGDGTGTFNISTATAFVCAGAGVTVAKHGNRSVSSKCGSADVLEALGVATELGKEGVEFCLREVGMAFLFAPYFHPAVRHVMPVRRALKVRTFFNILGPLCNPAGVRRYLIGAFSDTVAQMMARILYRVGVDKAITVHASDGLDEITTTGESHLFYADDDTQPRRAIVKPQHFHLPTATAADLKGDTADENSRILRSILNGEQGPKRDIVLMNATFALHASGRYPHLKEAMAAAKISLDEGHAAAKLDALAEASQDAPKLQR